MHQTVATQGSNGGHISLLRYKETGYGYLATRPENEKTGRNDFIYKIRAEK
jgi:hypothetical protein